MNTQMVNPHSHNTYEQDQGIGGGLHSAGGHHEHDEHHEKKSVIKKVKAKAKKIKDTIGSKIHGGHEHEHEHDREHDDQDLDEEDDFDDELEQDPEVHGAPMYESSAVMTGNENLNSGPTHLNVVDKGSTGPAGHLNVVDKGNTGPFGINFGEKGVPGPKRTDFGMKSNTGPTNVDLHDKPYTGQSRNNLGMSKTGESKTGLSMHTPLETDPGAPFGSDTSGNYQSKVTDPTGAGAKEADVEPIIRSFGKMEVTNEPGEKPAFTGTGSHDQFSPDDMSVDKESNRNPSYTEKITGATSSIAGSAASALTGTAASAKNAVGSAASSITGTAATAKNAVASKLGYGGSDNSNIGTRDTDLTRTEGTHTGSDQTKSTTAAVGDYGRKVASSITGTAATAKNAVASKLGYGGSDNSDIGTQETNLTRTEGAHTGGDQTKSTTAAVGDYGRKVASTVSEKLAPVYGTVSGVGSAVITPVYEKVAGAGSAVASKIQGTGSNTSDGTGSGAEAGTGTGGVGFVTEQDKGVSMKDYLVQKLSPGEEDKALSEVIVGVIHKKKDEFPPTVAENMDRVTDSPQVARTLGTGEHEYQKDGGDQGYGNDGSSVASGGGIGSPSGKGMVDRVKGVVSSWFGKGTGDQIYADEQRSTGGGMGEKKDESHGTGSTGVVN